MNFDGRISLKLRSTLRGASETVLSFSLQRFYLLPSTCVFVLKCRSTYPMFEYNRIFFFVREFSRKWFGNSRALQSARVLSNFPITMQINRALRASIVLWPPLWKRFLQDCRNFNAYWPIPCRYSDPVISFDLSPKEWTLLAQTVGQFRRTFKLLQRKKIEESFILGQFLRRIQRGNFQIITIKSVYVRVECKLWKQFATCYISPRTNRHLTLRSRSGGTRNSTRSSIIPISWWDSWV